ncbi:MAG: cytochrome b/b6 domain-containing protein [Rhizobiaceae bacterium]|nr:cytochrome b/b6 domain-containing protein [Rhizobiaceae bacterium]
MANRNVAGYSGLQIALHWAVVLLIVFQFLAHEGMEHANDAFQRGQAPGETDLLMANTHVVAGLLVLLLALARLWLRFTRGVPALPENEHPLLRFAAQTTHFLIYAAIIVMPLSGLAAWYFGIGQAGDVHETVFKLLLALIALHVAGALYQHFMLKTDVLRRMIRPVRA